MRPVYKSGRVPLLYDDYGPARRLLLESVGSYCAYCEAFLSSDIPVEHKVPHSQVGTAKDLYSNLLPACHACNRAKGANPAVKKGNEGLADHVKFPDLMSAILWPDDYPDEAAKKKDWAISKPDWLSDTKTFEYFRYPHSQRDLEHMALLKIKDGDRGQTWLDDVVDGAWVGVRSGLTSLQENRAYAAIRLLALNRCNPESQTFNDRRVLNRTRSWDMAVAAARVLLAAIEAKVVISEMRRETHSYLLNTCIETTAMVRLAAQQAGHWSVWLTVFGAALKDYPEINARQPLQKAILETLFMTRTLAGDPGHDPNRLIYPGTDIDRADVADFIR